MAKLPCIPQSRIFTLKETGETMSYDQVRQYLMSNPDLWLGKGEQKAEGKKADPLSSVEATAKALEGKDIKKLDGVRNVYFHGSKSGISKRMGFKPDEFGIHFGTFETANKLAEGRQGVTEAFLIDLKNPLKTERDFARWEWYVVSKLFNKDGVITDEQLEYVQNKKDNDALIKVLKDNGYDGIEYTNFYEGGGKSIIPFDQKSIIPISAAYHAAKKDGSNPELVKAVEDLLGEKAEGKQAAPNSPESIAARIRNKKQKGALSAIDFGISVTIYNGALEFMAAQVEKGTKLGNAIANTIKWIDDKMKGEKWNKEAFEKAFKGSPEVKPVTEVPIGKPIKKTETDLLVRARPNDILNNLNRYSLKELVTLLTQNDREGEYWQYLDTEEFPNKSEALAEARKDVARIFEDFDLFELQQRQSWMDLTQIEEAVSPFAVSEASKKKIGKAKAKELTRQEVELISEEKRMGAKIVPGLKFENIEGQRFEVVDVNRSTGDVTFKNLSDYEGYWRGTNTTNPMRNNYFDYLFYQVSEPAALEQKGEKEEDRVEKFLKDLYWKEGGLGMNVGLWNAAVTTMLKAYRAGKTVYEAIQAGIDYLTKEGENIKEYQSLIDKATDALKKDAEKQGRKIGTPPTAAQPQQKKATTPPPVTPPPTTTEGAELPETPEGQVPKKVVERRYKADSPEMQQALEEIGLFRTPGNINEAQAAANALVRKVGVDAALEVAEKETIDGLYKIGIIGAALDDIEARRNATNDYEEFIRLTNEAARVTAMGGKFLTTAGQELRMWQEILRSQTLPFEYEARKKAFVEQFGQDAFTKEVQERFEILDKQLKEALAKVNELEEQKAAWERQSVIDNLAEQKPEPPASRKSFFKEAAARVRKLIVSKPGIFSAATPASLAWDASIEAVAVALEGLGTLEIAIGKGLDKLRSTEWYRKLSQSKKDEAEKAFKESVEKAYIPEITVDDNGKVVIPQGALKAYVEAGYRDAEEIVDNIYNKLSPDNTNLTKRDVRDAISGYGRKYNPTPNQVRDQINEIKAIGRLISAIEDAENGIEKTTNPKTKKQISDRLQALKEQYEAAYINSFGRKPTQPSEATRYATVKRNMEKEIERLRAMKPRPERRPPVDYDAQLEALATEKFRLQEEWDAEFAKEEWRQKKWWEIVGDVAYASTQLPKSMMAGGLDLGMLTIQASLMSMTDAKLTGTAFKALGKSLWSEKEYQKEIAKIRNSELYRIIRKSGLDISTPVGLSGMAEEVGTDTLAEGLFNLMILWMKYIPKYGPKSYEIAKRFNFIRALNRAQVAYMNTLKVGTFLIDMQNMKERGITFYNNPEAYKEAADAINVMSGRSKLFGAERSKVVMRGLNIAIFSPRNWASILRLFTPWLLVEIATKRAGADPYKMSVSQARIVKNMAKYVAGTALLMYAIKAMTSDDDEDEEKKRERGNVSIDWENPQSSAFNKIRIGNQILDPWGGKMQIITLQARLLIHAMGGYAYKDPYTGIEKKLEDSYFKTPGGLVGEYVKGKFAPSLRAPWQLANSVPVPGRPGWYRPVEGGKEFYIFEPFKESFENLTIQAVKETYGEQPLTLSEITALMIIAGTGSTLLDDQEDLTTVTKIRNLLSPGEDEIKKFKKAFGSYLKAGDYDMAEKIFDRATGTTPLYQNLQLQQEMGKSTSEAKRQLDRKRKQSVADLFGGIQEDNLVQKYSFEKKYRDEIIDAVYKDKTLSTYGMSEKKAKMFERINALTPEMKEDIKRNYDLQYEELMTVAKGLDKVAERADGYYEKKAKRTPWVRQYLKLTGKEEKQ